MNYFFVAVINSDGHLKTLTSVNQFTKHTLRTTASENNRLTEVDVLSCLPYGDRLC
jgi:hypothetical protein